MVEPTQAIQAAEAIRSLFAAGVDEREIHELVTAVAAEPKPTKPHGTNENGLEVYEVLPEDLIDLPSAARKYERHIGTLNAWTKYRGLEVVARLRAPARGGGYLVVRESDLAKMNAETPRRKR